MITDEDKERVRKATDFLQLVGETVELRRRGADWWGCCPFHHEKSPSFHVNPSTGLWKCFGCGLGGDVFGYVMHRENLEFVDAIRYLADKAGIELTEERGGRRGPKRNRLIECLTEAESYYATMLNRGKGGGPANGRKYLSGRGFGSATCRKWKLGYAPGHGMLMKHLRGKGFSNQEMEACDLALFRGGMLADRFYDRVMFPIHDEQGRTIGFGGRVLGDAKPKYLNTKETPVFHKGKHLFAFDMAKEHIAARGEAIVCEGYTDVIALHEAGYPVAVAALGTSFSIDHVRTLARFAKRIICMFDGDAAGQRAAERAIQFIDKSEADLRCVVLPNSQDPAEFLDTHRASDLEPILASAEPLMDFVLRKRLEGVGPSTPAGVRMSLLADLARVLSPLRQSVVLDEYANVVGDWLGISPQRVKDAIRSVPATSEWEVPQRQPQQQQQPQPQPANPYVASDDDRRQLQAERELLAIMSANPALMREYADRIAGIMWVDGRHEAIAWSILATPEDATPAQAVAAASAVVPDAPFILSEGRIASQSGVSDEAKAAFVLDAVDLYSTRRKIQDLRSRMRSDASASQSLFLEATNLQKLANKLANRLASGFNS